MLVVSIEVAGAQFAVPQIPKVGACAVEDAHDGLGALVLPHEVPQHTVAGRRRLLLVAFFPYLSPSSRDLAAGDDARSVPRGKLQQSIAVLLAGQLAVSVFAVLSVSRFVRRFLAVRCRCG